MLYGLAFLMLATLAAVDALPAFGTARPVLECVLALGGCACMAAWTRRNSAALDLQDWCECATEKTVMRIIPSHRRESVLIAASHPPPVRHRSTTRRASNRRTTRT